MSDRELFEASTEMPKREDVKSGRQSAFRILDASQPNSNYLSVSGSFRTSRGLDRRSMDDLDRNRSKSPAATREALGIGCDKTLSNTQAIIHLLKATVGTGVLAMPSASRDAGILLGPLACFIVGMIVVHSMQLLVRTAQFLRGYFDIGAEVCELDYAETVRRTLRYSHWNFRRVFAWLPHYLQFCLIFSQFGFLSVYLLFISENTMYMVNHYQPSFKQPIIVYEVCVFVFLIPLTFIRTLKRLAIFCGLANLLAIASLLLSLVYFILNLQPIEEFQLTKTFDTIPMFFGVIIFSFESINVVMPVENKMRDKSAMPGYNGVLNVSMVISVCLFVAIAFYGYLALGESVGGSFTYSIKMDHWYFMIIVPMYTVSIFISFALQYYVLFTLLWELVESRLTTQRSKFWGDIVIRVGGLIMCFILAAVVPHVDLMISLIGAFSGSSITLLFPPLVHSVIVYGERYQMPRWKLVISKNLAIIFIGICGAVIGTYTSIVQIIKAFSS